MSVIRYCALLMNWNERSFQLYLFDLFATNKGILFDLLTYSGVLTFYFKIILNKAFLTLTFSQTIGRS